MCSFPLVKSLWWHYFNWLAPNLDLQFSAKAIPPSAAKWVVKMRDTHERILGVKVCNVVVSELTNSKKIFDCSHLKLATLIIQFCLYFFQPLFLWPQFLISSYFILQDADFNLKHETLSSQKFIRLWRPTTYRIAVWF